MKKKSKFKILAITLLVFVNPLEADTFYHLPMHLEANTWEVRNSRSEKNAAAVAEKKAAKITAQKALIRQQAMTKLSSEIKAAEVEIAQGKEQLLELKEQRKSKGLQALGIKAAATGPGLAVCLVKEVIPCFATIAISGPILSLNVCAPLVLGSVEEIVTRAYGNGGTPSSMPVSCGAIAGVIYDATVDLINSSKISEAEVELQNKIENQIVQIGNFKTNLNNYNPKAANPKSSKNLKPSINKEGAKSENSHFEHRDFIDRRNLRDNSKDVPSVIGRSAESPIKESVAKAPKEAVAKLPRVKEPNERAPKPQSQAPASEICPKILDKLSEPKVKNTMY